MKLKCALIAVFVGMGASAHAAVDTNFVRMAEIKPCELDAYAMAVRDEKWNRLAMKYFMAGVDGDDPEKMRKVRREVAVGVAALRREYGTDCVLDIH